MLIQNKLFKNIIYNNIKIFILISGGQKSRDSLDRMLKTFSSTYDRLEGENLRSIVVSSSNICYINFILGLE